MRLEVGDSIFTQNGSWVRVESIVYRPGSVHTYSFRLVNQDAPTYFANGCLAHNTDYDCTLACFPSNTMVQMADGTTREIQQIKVGDKVLSYDLATGRYTTSTVLSAKESTQRVYSLNNGFLYFTESHPLYVKKLDGRICWAAVNPEKAQKVYGLSSVQQLELGDRLYIDKTGWNTIVYSIIPENLPVVTYTLKLSEPNTFFANGVLVYGLASDADAHTIHERFVGIKVVYKTYDSEPPWSMITNRGKLRSRYYGLDSITFNWTGNDDATNSENLVYKYRIDPLVDGWIPGGSDPDVWTRNTTVTFNSTYFNDPNFYFPRGNYTFRVRARDESGKWETNETGDNVFRFSVEVAANNVTGLDIDPADGPTSVSTPVLDNDLILIRLFNDSELFANIWRYNFTSLSYIYPTSAGEYGVTLTNGAIIFKTPGGEYVKKCPSIITEDDRVILHFYHFYLPEIFSVGGTSETICRFSSRVVENAIQEYSTSWKFDMQIFDENNEPDEKWIEYIMGNYDRFSQGLDVNNDGVVDTLVYSAESYPISILTIRTIVEISLEGYS
ncbi:MAG TPA: hypothetical protein ENI42_00710 [Thermoplasmatales archaeon]|nr:hypothetical protein [Thermoplasmatales archaeon]